jgi:hypothetical protein
MAAQRPQQPRQNVFDRLLAVQVRKAGYHLPELGVAGYVLAAAATLPTPVAAAAIATPGIMDVAAKARRGRGLIRDLHTNAAVRRRWTHACVRGGAANRPPLHSVELDTPYGPRPVKVERVPTGHRIHLYSPKSFDDLIANQSKVEGLLGCRFTLKVDTLNPSRAVATLIECDALRDLEPLDWPLADATHTSVWDPLPFGWDDDYQPVYLGGMGAGHALIAGITGSGKTTLMNLEIAQAALDPTCNVTIIDGAGGVDYIPWAGAVQALVDENIQDAVDALQAIRDEIRRTGTKLKGENIERVTPTVCGPVTDERAIHTHRIVLDEAGYFFNHQQTDKAREFTNLYRELIQLGRKFGLQFILGMQRPSATSISTDVRSQFAYRVGLRTADAETTRMLFPEHDAPRCHEIEAEGFAGVGYVKAEGGGFIRAKTYYLPRHQLDAIAARVRDLDLDTQRATWDPDPTPSDTTGPTVEPCEPTTEPSRPQEERSGPAALPEPANDRPYDQATHDTFDDIISQFDEPDAPASIPPPQARSAEAGEGEDAPASEPPGEALAVDETLAFTTLLQLIHDAPPSVIRAGRRPGQTGVRRDYLDMRMLRRVGKGWFAFVGRALDRGLLVMYKAPSGPKGGQPAKLYALTPAGVEFLRRNAGTR